MQCAKSGGSSQKTNKEGWQRKKQLGVKNVVNIRKVDELDERTSAT
jgi:hypothetical protein